MVRTVSSTAVTSSSYGGGMLNGASPQDPGAPRECASGVDPPGVDPVLETVTSRIYGGDSAFILLSQDVDSLSGVLDRALQHLALTDPSQSGLFTTYKDNLLADSRTFVTDSKLLVSSATHSKDRLVENINLSMKTLCRIVHHCSVTMPVMTSLAQAANLGAKVKDVTQAYKSTVSAAYSAAGRPLSDPNMKQLMKQATSLAAILSTLMKTLKGLDTSW